MAKVDSIFRYPIKGLSAQRLANIDVKKDKGFAFDRAWAIENGTSDFDPDNPRFFPKRRFLQLAQYPDLARLNCDYEAETGVLTVSIGSETVLNTDMNKREDIGKIEAFFEAFLQGATHGRPRLVTAPEHHFCDIPQNAISLINLASVDAITAAAGTDVAPLRFRGNLHVSGLDPWEEMNWEGKTLTVDGVDMFKVFAITGRCPATQVNLETGKRDIDTLAVLQENFGHTKCGVYLQAIADGSIREGAELKAS